MRLDHIIVSLRTLFFDVLLSLKGRKPAPLYAGHAAPCFVPLLMPGDYCEEAIPVPIPNTEVKLFYADDTAATVGK